MNRGKNKTVRHKRLLDRVLLITVIFGLLSVGWLAESGLAGLGSALNPGNWGGPAGLQVKPPEIPPATPIDDISFSSADSILSLRGYRLTLPGEIWQSAYDPSSNTVLVGYFVSGKKDYTTKNCRIVLVDITQKKSVWSVASNGIIEHLVGGAAVIGNIFGPSYGQSQVLDATSGQFIRQAETDIRELDDNIVLTFSDTGYAQIDMKSGKFVWEKNSSPYLGYKKIYRDGDQMLVVADGIESFKLENGEGWKFESSTSHDATGKAIREQVALGVLGAVSGTDDYTTFGAMNQVHTEVTHNACSQPLRADSLIYFAAEKTLFGIEAQSGKCKWQAEMPRELGSLKLVLADSNLAVVGTGWKYVDFVVRKAEHPSIGLYSLSKGEPIGIIELDKASVVLDVYYTHENIYVLLPGEIRQFSNTLVPIATFIMPKEYGQLIRFIPSDRNLIVRTITGIVALEPNTLKELWNVPGGKLEPVKMMGYRGKEFSEAAKPLWQQELEIRHSYSEGDTLWLAGQGGVKAIDLKSGRAIMEMSLDGDASISQHGVVEAMGGTNLTIIPLVKSNSQYK